MNDKSKLSDLNQVSARRRLIRGAFSVPAVLTVATGSAMATTSPTVCAARLPTGVSVGTNDTYFRVQRYTALVGTSHVPVVRAQDIRNRVGPHGIDTSWCGTKDWIRVSDAAAVTPNANTVPTSDGSSAFVALRFTNHGTDKVPVFRVSGLSTGLTTGTGSGGLLTGSCWSSFAP